MPSFQLQSKMTSRILRILRAAFVPAFIWAGFIAYGYSLAFFAETIPSPEKSMLLVGALLSQGFFAAATTSLLFSYPLALIYRKSAVAVALAMSLPVLVLRIPEFTDPDRHPFAIVISAYELLAYAMLLIMGTWLTQRHLTHTPHSRWTRESDPP